MKSSTAVDHKCPGCNASLDFNPKTQKWNCNYCGQSWELKDLKKHKEKFKSKASKEDNGEYDLYRCSSCGAEIVTDTNTSATFCVYCKNTAIIKERLVGKFEPKYILPFSKTIDDAKTEFKRLIRKHPLAPKEFTKPSNITEIRGIYIPFWLFSGTSNGGLTIEGTKVKTWRSGDYVYTKRDYYEVIREGNVTISKVPNDGAVKFDDAIMNSIEPFDYEHLKEFDSSYLSGFLSEKYDVSMEDAKKNVVKRMETTVKKELMNTVDGYSMKKIVQSDISFPDLDIEYALLPVYMVNVKYEGKMYTFAMNGESGKIIGNIPVSPLKVVAAFTILYIVFLILLIAFFFIFMRGNV